MSEFDPVSKTAPDFIRFSSDGNAMGIDMTSDSIPDDYLFRLITVLRTTSEQPFTITAYCSDRVDLTINSSELKTCFEEDDLIFIHLKTQEMMEAQFITIEKAIVHPQEMMPGVEYIPQTNS